MRDADRGNQKAPGQFVDQPAGIDPLVIAMPIKTRGCVGSAWRTHHENDRRRKRDCHQRIRGEGRKEFHGTDRNRTARGAGKHGRKLRAIDHAAWTMQ